jgi:hypothetical protein
MIKANAASVSSLTGVRILASLTVSLAGVVAMTAANQQVTGRAAETPPPADTAELPSIEQLAQRASERAWSIRSMSVESDRTISFLRITKDDLEQVGLTEFPIDGLEAIRLFKEKVQSADVHIKADMDRRRFDVRMWNPGDDRMKTRYVIERVEDGAVIREEQWYPILNDYRTVRYVVEPGDQPPLVECRLKSCLLDAVEDSGCALGDFEAHWLPEDRGGSGFLTNLIPYAVGRADIVVECEQKDEDSDGISYQLRRLVYDIHNDVEGEPQPRHNYRYDLTTLDADLMYITNRTLVFATIRPDKQGAYLVMACQYHYTNVVSDDGEAGR